MIANFRDRRLKRYYARGDASLLPADMLARIQSILARLDIAGSIDDLRLHSYRLHPLKGDLKGYWSITVKANWRIIFRFRAGNALDVELIDYH
jgi:proteic killer suppression protein